MAATAFGHHQPPQVLYDVCSAKVVRLSVCLSVHV